MTYLNCPRCHLAILERVMRLLAGDCPRCLAREGVRSLMFASPLPYRELTNAGPTEPVAQSGNRRRHAPVA